MPPKRTNKARSVYREDASIDAFWEAEMDDPGDEDLEQVAITVVDADNGEVAEVINARKYVTRSYTSGWEVQGEVFPEANSILPRTPNNASYTSAKRVMPPPIDVNSKEFLLKRIAKLESDIWMMWRIRKGSSMA